MEHAYKVNITITIFKSTSHAFIESNFSTVEQPFCYQMLPSMITFPYVVTGFHRKYKTKNPALQQ